LAPIVQTERKLKFKQETKDKRRRTEKKLRTTWQQKGQKSLLLMTNGGGETPQDESENISGHVYSKLFD